MLSRTLSVLVLGIACSVPVAAMAQTVQNPDFAAAKKHFKAGQAFMQMSRFAEAVVEFKKAYDITQDGLVMGQVADAYAKGNDYENALASIKIYRQALPVDERSSADELIKEYQKAIKEGRSKPLLDPAEQPPPSSPTNQPIPQSGLPSVEQPSTSTPPTPEAPPAAPSQKQSGRFYTWIAASAAGALAVGALVMGINAQNKYDELSGSSGCKPNCSDSDVDSVKKRALITDILVGSAVAAGITAGILYFVEGRPDKIEKNHELQTNEKGQARYRRHLQLMPIAGQGLYGLRAGVNF